MTIDPVHLAVPTGRATPATARPAAGHDKTQPVPAPTDTVTLSESAVERTGNAAANALSANDEPPADTLPTVDELRAAFMSRPGSDGWNKRADLNADGVVNYADMAALRERMEPAPAGNDSDTTPSVEDIRASFLSSAGDQQWNPNADMNGDGQVNFADLAALRQSMAPPATPGLSVSDLREAFLSTSTSGNWNAAADLDGDGRVNFADLAMLRARMSDDG